MKQSIFLPSTSILTTEDIEILNKTFCEFVCLRPQVCAVADENLEIVHYYINISCTSKRPKDISSYRVFSFKDKPLYPDFINNNNNFMKLLNIQWEQSGQLGSYTQTHCEKFSVNYITNKLTSLIMVANKFIDNNIDEYIDAIHNESWEYDITSRLEYEI